jgi:PKD repeat protein
MSKIYLGAFRMPFPRLSRRRRRPERCASSRLAAVVAATLGLALLTIGPAAADTAPVAPVTTPTVSTDALPTVQVNGVVWKQLIVGNTVYATGAFTSARPAGSAAGTNETPRSNILAYNLSTGALITTWAPTLNAQGLALAASPDGTRIYVGGDFTSVSGVAKNRIVALNASTGAVITGFAASVNSRVRSLVATADTVYAGGAFTTSSGAARSRLAAFTASTGALTTWAPVADAEVMAIVAPAGSGEIVAGGRFANLAGQPAFGMGAVDITTGASLPWAANTVVQNKGSDAAIYSLSTDGAHVFGTGYTYLVNPGDENDGNLENTFEATAAGGALVWVSGCRGDTYDSAPLNGALYFVSHTHDCSAIGGNPQTNPVWTYQHAWADQIAPAADHRVNTNGAFTGLPGPELLHWLPDLDVGSYTGQSQAAWTVTGNSQYVVLGGEFPKVNGTAQQGLVRFAVSSIAPNKDGPQITTSLTPTVVALAPARTRISWQAAYDRDNENLTYEVLRGSTVIATTTQGSAWYNRPNMSFNDATVAPGSTQTYRIRVHDAFNNTGYGPTTTFTVPTGGVTSSYANAVLGDGASHLWRLGEPGGATGYDWAAADDLAVDSSATRGADGALTNESTAKSTTFAGTAAVPAVTPNPVLGPQSFTEEAWFKTTSSTGGKIIGFGDSNAGTSSNYDRQIYMTNAGNLVFGVYSSGPRTLTSPLPYNDGQWHQVVASLDSSGMVLYLDGKRVARDTGVTGAQVFSGYWRVGGDNLGGWTGQPSSNDFTGGIEDVALYPAALTLAQVQSHYQASGRSLNLPSPPTDAYGAAVWNADPTLFWRLDETSGSTATDRMTNSPSGTYSAGVVLGQPGSPAAPTGTSAGFPGGSAQTLVATTPAVNPTVFSLETWFKTTTTSGGRLIGFGNAPSGSSNNYDRQLYMLDDGTLRYGIYDGSVETITSPHSYNDGQWHQAVATQGSNGEQLFVDGALVASGPATTPQEYTGYWRLGSDNTWGGNDTNDFAGSLDEVAIYDTVLAGATVAQHYQLGAPAAPNQKPTASFSSTATNLAATFDASASADPDGTIASYAWDFGDGSTGTGATPSHTYATADTFTVTLKVTDNSGATDTVTHLVTTTLPANQKPTAAFSQTCTNLACTFNGSASADPDGTIAAYAWDFGDGGTSTSVSPSHTFAAGTYSVKLAVTDNRGGTDSVTQSVTVAAANQSPTAAFTPTCTNLACSFNSSASVDPDGTIASYAWSFGDGSTSTTANPSHTFAAGTYTVTLVVTDNKGATGTASNAVMVTAAPNQNPTAAFTPTCTNLACTFDSSASVDPDGTIASYAWDFGDGSTSTTAKPSHSFSAAGTYSVKLTVTDNRGGTNAITQSVTVAKANQAPAAAFTPTCTNLACTFDSSAAADSDGTIASYLWAFGDGSTSTSAGPSHTYTAAGTYTVSLTVTDNQGATGTASHPVTVAAAPAVLATDTFTRTVTNGLGSANTGGVWTLSGASSYFAVNGSVGSMKMPTAGYGLTGYLNSVSATSTDSQVSFSVDKVGTGNGVYITLAGRKTSAGEYRARARLLSTGGVAVQLSKYIGTTETVIGTEQTVSGLTYAAGTQLKMRMQVTGTGTTSLQMKVWRADGTEPTTWQRTGTDTTASLQSAGAVGLEAYLSGSSTNAPITAAFDNLQVNKL